MKTAIIVSGLFAAGVSCFAACSGSSAGQQSIDTDGGSAAASGGGSGGSSASGSGGGLTGGAGGGVLLDTGVGGGTGGTGGFDPDSGCAAETVSGESIPVDMYVMLDKSGSMTDPSGGGQSKWDAVKAAFTSFLNDSQSAGLGVGIQYFPEPASGVPASCTNNAQCGTWGPCLLKTCDGTGTVIPCAGDSDCGPGEGKCVDLGICSSSGGFCVPPGSSCGLLDPCLQISPSICTKADCDVAEYSSPDVPIAVLPGVAAQIIASLGAQMPQGLTPTSAALQGAVDHATAHAMANPAHKVLVVLATDGLPTECDIDIGDVAQIADDAHAGSPSISTFVIGVFEPSEPMGPANADQIAMAGGTKSAFIIDPSGNVTQQFLDALDAIRGTSLGCEFQIPLPQDGGVLDFNEVNVTFTDPGGAKQELYYVGDQSQCDPTNGGWYYDADPSAGGTPTKIIVCPSTCDTFDVIAGGQVNIALGCETVVKPPQ